MGSDEKFTNCKWVNIKCIFNSYNGDLEQKVKFLDNIKNLNYVLKLLEFKGLTLAGRHLAFKSLSLLKLLFACKVKVPSGVFVDQINTLYKNFITKNERPKIKHSTLIADYCKGGYKDVKQN